MFSVSLYSTVPTQEQILVPETLLKKRKSAEKAAADNLVAAKDRKDVRIPLPHPQHTTFLHRRGGIIAL